MTIVLGFYPSLVLDLISSSVDKVRIVVTPTVKGLLKNGRDAPLNYGYSIDLFDDKGEPSGTAVSLMIPLDFKSREK